jgi:hypothetical protein
MVNITECPECKGRGEVERRTDIRGHVPNCSIEDIVLRWRDWLGSDVELYLHEQNAPDLWTQLRSFSDFISPELTDTSQLPFTAGEKQQAQESIVRFRILLLDEFKPDAEQLQRIDERLDYLARGVERLNRFDWQGLLLNTLISVGITLTLDVERGRVLYSLAVQAFNSLVKLLQ